MSIGTDIKFYRKKMKMTQMELSTKANLSRSYLADIEADRYNPSVETLKSIAEALQIGAHLLLGEEHPSISPSFNDAHLSPKEERDIAKKLQNMMDDLNGQEAWAFMGEPMDEEDKELLRISLENALRISKQMAKKKFTPKKYRK